MISNDFMHVEGGIYVYTTEYPFMGVIANTHAIGYEILQKNIVWYGERKVKRELDKLRAVEEEKPNPANLAIMPHVTEDTSPSEMNPEADISHYMEGNTGC
jgi:hypothetical protein